jgi:hypothetical protein
LADEPATTQPIEAVEPEVDDAPPIESHDVEETPAEAEKLDIDTAGQDAPESTAQTNEAHLEEGKGDSLDYVAAAGAVIAGGAVVESLHTEEAPAPVSESREVDEPLKEEPTAVEEHVHEEEVHGMEDGITGGAPAVEPVVVHETEMPTQDAEIDHVPGIIQSLSVS